MKFSKLTRQIKSRRIISLAGPLVALTLLVWTISEPVGAQPPGRPLNPGGQGSIAVMVIDFDLYPELLQGTFAAQNKDPQKNGTITVPGGGEFVILLQERVGREWIAVDVTECTFEPVSVQLPDDAFHPVDFECTACDIDAAAKSVRVVAIVPLDGRYFLSRLSQKLF